MEAQIVQLRDYFQLQELVLRLQSCEIIIILLPHTPSVFHRHSWTLSFLTLVPSTWRFSIFTPLSPEDEMSHLYDHFLQNLVLLVIFFGVFSGVSVSQFLLGRGIGKVRGKDEVKEKHKLSSICNQRPSEIFKHSGDTVKFVF